MKHETHDAGGMTAGLSPGARGTQTECATWNHVPEGRTRLNKGRPRGGPPPLVFPWKPPGASEAGRPPRDAGGDGGHSR